MSEVAVSQILQATPTFVRCPIPFGAALLAGVVAGGYPDVAAAVEAAVATAGTVEPNPEATSAYDKGYEVYRTLYGALKPAFDALMREGA